VNWLALLMDALDEAHPEHDEGCDCYDRLALAVREGEYRFPEVSHDVEEPPVYGCETLLTYTMRQCMKRTEEMFYQRFTIDTALLRGFMEPTR
jgi:hypothetical protein